MPAGPPTPAFALCFWRPVQHDLLVPWAHRFLDEVTNVSGGGLLALGGMVRHMRPSTCDDAWLQRASDLANSDDVQPVVRTELQIGVDMLSRVLRARS